jgi:hypothetical protein
VCHRRWCHELEELGGGISDAFLWRGHECRFGRILVGLSWDHQQRGDAPVALEVDGARSLRSVPSEPDGSAVNHEAPRVSGHAASL